MLDDLYQAIILDHGRKPRNHRKIEGATHRAEGYNPLCGDRLVLELLVEGGKIKDVAFEGCGCAISQASASLLSLEVKGLSAEEATGLSLRLRLALTKDGPMDGLGELECLLGVRRYANRVKCATLAWHALDSALGEGGVVSTEARAETEQ
ncbi:MAG: Fe-S cluster assembly sulfur transfer protein SufU [Fimbriimonadaceae bacterium]